MKILSMSTSAKWTAGLTLAALVAALFGPVCAAEEERGPAEAGAASPAPDAAPQPADEQPRLNLLKPKPQMPPAPLGPGPVVVVTITEDSPGGAISTWNVGYIQRCLERARKQQVGLFVIQLTTNGGSGKIMAEMAEAISGARDIHTTMYVKGRAFSAGAMIALACDDIYMEPGSVVGAATPILLTSEGVANLPEEVKEKFMRAGVTEFEAMAHKKGHSAQIAAAMVDPGLEVLAVRRASDGPIELMNREEYEAALKGPNGRRVQIVEVVNNEKRLLVFTDKEAVKWGLAVDNPHDLNTLVKSVGLADRQIVMMEPSLSEVMARFFSSGFIVALLIAAATIALYMELNHPSGVAAGFFLLALGLFFWASFMAGTANAVSIIMVLAGAALLAIEIFFIPGFGVTGISGAILVVLGMVVARIPPDVFTSPGGKGGGFTPPVIRWDGLWMAVLPVLAGFGLGAAAIAILMRFFPRLPLFNRMVLSADLSGAVVTSAQAAGAERPEQLVGLVGVASTVLRPGGSARFDGRLLDVVSDGEFIEAGVRVRIVSADSNRIVVRRA